MPRTHILLDSQAQVSVLNARLQVRDRSEAALSQEIRGELQASRQVEHT